MFYSASHYDVTLFVSLSSINCPDLLSWGGFVILAQYLSLKVRQHRSWEDWKHLQGDNELEQRLRKISLLLGPEPAFKLSFCMSVFVQSGTKVACHCVFFLFTNIYTYIYASLWENIHSVLQSQILQKSKTCATGQSLKKQFELCGLHCIHQCLFNTTWNSTLLNFEFCGWHCIQRLVDNFWVHSLNKRTRY